MHHNLYKIINLLNGKFYVGVHSTKNINDSYFGSGVVLRKAIKKYGKVNFKKEILLKLTSLDEVYEIESMIVDLKFINRPDVYNARIGGHGGFSDADRVKGQIALNLNRDSVNTKRKTTNLLKYGCEHISQQSSIINLVKTTKLEKYGSESYNNIEKNKQTVLEKYGVSNVMYLPHIVEKIQTTKKLNDSVSRLVGKENPRALTYKFISPVGDKYIVVGEFEKFCNDNNLSFSKMCRWKNKGKIINKISQNITPQFVSTNLSDNCIGWDVMQIVKF